jgi:hypothetical protein
MDGRQEAIRADFQSNLTRIGDAVAARKRVADRDEQQLAAMSALPPKRIETQLRDVRFVPKADSCAAAKHSALLLRISRIRRLQCGRKTPGR